SGILATGRVLGQTLSVALAGAVFAAKGGVAAGECLARWPLDPAARAALGQTFEGALRASFEVCAALASAGVLTALVRGEGRKQAAGVGSAPCGAPPSSAAPRPTSCSSGSLARTTTRRP